MKTTHNRLSMFALALFISGVLPACDSGRSDAEKTIKGDQFLLPGQCTRVRTPDEIKRGVPCK